MVVNKVGRTGTDAFPDINTLSFWVPDTALGEWVPVDVELPDTRCVADDSRHVVGSWIGINFERGERRGEEDSARYGELEQ
jgi:hypothetical protein